MTIEFFTSHEALLLPYEEGVTRQVPRQTGCILLDTLLTGTIRNFTGLRARAATPQARGAIQDIGRIARIAHRYGAMAVIDAYQATGQLPTDVHAADVDVLITGGLKWLLGGTGIAFLYVRKEMIPKLSPTITGWFGNARQWEFDPRTFEAFELYGLRSVPAAAVAATPAPPAASGGPAPATK